MKNKPYKISIRHYFNMKLKPTSVSVVDAKGKETTKDVFPLYVQVIFRTKTNLIRSWNDFALDLFPFDNDVEKLKADAKFSGYLKKEAQFLENIIRYEAEAGENNFTLNGLGERYFYYRQTFVGLLDKKMKRILQKEYSAFSKLDELAFDFSEKNSRLSFAHLLRIIETASPKFLRSLDFEQKIQAYDSMVKYLMKNSKFISEEELSEEEKIEAYLFWVQTIGIDSPTVLDWITGTLWRDYSNDNPKNNVFCNIIDEIISIKKRTFIIM